jgi:hypothetical protein
MIFRALRCQSFLRTTRFQFADDKGRDGSVLDSSDLDLDVKSELRKKFTG